MKTAMVVFASEQLLPNLAAVMHWRQNLRRLDAVCIYYTADEQRSALPARRLELLLQRLYPGLMIYRSSKPLGITPQDVTQALAGWQKVAGPDFQWVINVTGGLKMMAIGAASFAFDQGHSLIYRELNGGWFKISRSAKGTEADNLEIPLHITDSVSVDTLVSLQCPSPSHYHWSSQEPQPVDLRKVTQAVDSMGLNWRGVCEKFAEKARAGAFLEHLVARVLMESGCQHCRTNLRLISASSSPLEEIDVVVNRLGRLIIVDCKLGASGGAYIAQMDQASQRSHELGGLSAVYALVRPNIILPPAHQALAKARKLVLIDASQPTLFPHLLDALNLQPQTPAARDFIGAINRAASRLAATPAPRVVSKPANSNPTSAKIPARPKRPARPWPNSKHVAAPDCLTQMEKDLFPDDPQPLRP